MEFLLLFLVSCPLDCTVEVQQLCEETHDPMEILEPTKAYQNLPESSRIHRSPPKPIKAYQSLPESSRV